MTAPQRWQIFICYRSYVATSIMLPIGTQLMGVG
jgi:hypothetical protein